MLEYINKYMQAAILIAIVIIIWNVASMNTSNNEEYLYGLWVGDDIFCEDAEIDSMLLFLGEPECGFRKATRNGYIVIQSDGETVCNQGFVLKYSPGWAGPGISKYTIHGSIDFDEEAIWTDDGRINITIDIKTGTMRVYYGEDLYAKLYKQHDLSNILIE